MNGNSLTDAGRNVGQGDAAGGTGRNVNQLKKKEKTKGADATEETEIAETAESRMSRQRTP